MQPVQHLLLFTGFTLYTYCLLTFSNLSFSILIMKLKILQIVILFQLFLPGVLLAVEPAPDITDREIIEKLAKLESGQQALNQRVSDLRSEMKVGQENLRAEMKVGQENLRAEMKSGQENLRTEMKAGQQALNQRISDLRSEMKAG
ncbi:MAG: hypothetical protein U9P10_01605, partial [Thermodesulfobacteriota bacterium]|nr:hypothetical protein [Thermodesulfobacteriota bacterium]